MYSVLLADDERLDLEGMKRLVPWERLNMKVEATMNSGFDALEYLKQRPVDVLVTDVRMPRMSGLELAQAALSMNPLLKVVFISGYDDFHYAKTAIKMGASNYVLKPVDDDEFMRTMNEVRVALDHEREIEHHEKTYEQSLPYLRNRLIQGCLEGEISGEKLLEESESVSLQLNKGPYAAALIEIDDISWKLNAYKEEERVVIIDRIREFIAHTCLNVPIGHPCKINGNRIGVIMENHERMHLATLIEKVKQQFPVSITIGMGSRVPNIGEVSQSYLQARKALSFKLICGKGRIITMNDIESHSVAEANNLDEILSRLFRAACDYELVEIDDCLLELFSLAGALSNKMTAYNFSVHIITKLNEHLHKFNEDLYRLLGMEYQNVDVLYHFETIEDIRSWFRRKMFEVSEKLYTKKNSKNGKLLKEVKSYMDEHLLTELTLRDVADHFFFSPNHLGFLFKEETGETFSEYMIRERMKAAKELLCDTKLKVYEVANLAGYQNIAYFSRQFKEIYGLTPGEFRKQN